MDVFFEIADEITDWTDTCIYVTVSNAPTESQAIDFVYDMYGGYEQMDSYADTFVFRIIREKD